MMTTQDLIYIYEEIITKPEPMQDQKKRNTKIYIILCPIENKLAYDRG